MKLKYYTIRFSLALFLIVINMWSIAQPPPGGPPPGGGGSTGTLPPCWDPSCIPIDGGLGFLLVAGTILGVYTLYSKRSKTV